MDQPEKRKRAQRLFLGSTALSVLFMACGVQAETYNLSTEILVGTCTVTSSPNVVPLADVPRDVLNSGTLQQLVPLTLSAQGCVGVGPEGTSPVLRVTGTTTAAPGGAGDYLFNDGGENSTAKGYGIVVSTQSDTTWNTDNLIKNGDPYRLRDINTDSTLYVAVGCGDATTCSQEDTDHTSGSLSAGITFTFEYQ